MLVSFFQSLASSSFQVVITRDSYHVLAIIEASVHLSVRHALDLYQNGAT